MEVLCLVQGLRRCQVVSKACNSLSAQQTLLPAGPPSRSDVSRDRLRHLNGAELRPPLNQSRPAVRAGKKTRINQCGVAFPNLLAGWRGELGGSSSSAPTSLQCQRVSFNTHNRTAGRCSDTKKGSAGKWWLMQRDEHQAREGKKWEQ